MKQIVVNYVSECDVCQKSKDKSMAYLGLLPPFPIPDQAWRHISMDCSEGLPKSKGKDIIFSVG